VNCRVIIIKEIEFIFYLLCYYGLTNPDVVSHVVAFCFISVDIDRVSPFCWRIC